MVTGKYSLHLPWQPDLGNSSLAPRLHTASDKSLGDKPGNEARAIAWLIYLRRQNVSKFQLV